MADRLMKTGCLRILLRARAAIVIVTFLSDPSDLSPFLWSNLILLPAGKRTFLNHTSSIKQVVLSS